MSNVKASFLGCRLEFSTNGQTGELKEDGEADSDFELWEPKHPDGCLFGHIAQYHRKIPTHNCYIGKAIKQPHKILKNCECARRDYEWYVLRYVLIRSFTN